MNFPRVETFLCCIPLKVGGYVIGWISIVISLLLFCICSFFLVLIYIQPEFFVATGSLIGAIIYFVSYDAYSVLLFLSSCIMMRGISKKKYLRLIPFIIILIVGMITGFLQIIMTGWNGFAPAILIAIFDTYCLICIISLYQKLEVEKKDEDERYVYITTITKNF